MHRIASSLLVLLTAGADLSHAGPPAAEDGEGTVRKILADWDARRHRMDRFAYEVEGTELWTADSLTNRLHVGDERGRRPHAPPPRRFPNKDYQSRVKAVLEMDLEHGRARYEWERDTPTGEYEFRSVALIRLHDGEQRLLYRPLERNAWLASIRGEREIKKDSRDLYFFSEVVRPLLDGHGLFAVERYKPSATSFRTANFNAVPKLEDLQVLGTEERNGRRCVLLLRDLTREPKETVHEHVWVDLERESAIVRVAHVVDGSEGSSTDVKHVETSDGWMPQAWTVVSRSYQDGEVFHREELRVSRREGNPVLPVERFQVMASDPMN